MAIKQNKKIKCDGCGTLNSPTLDYCQECDLTLKFKKNDGLIVGMREEEIEAYNRDRAEIKKRYESSKRRAPDDIDTYTKSKPRPKDNTKSARKKSVPKPKIGNTKRDNQNRKPAPKSNTTSTNNSDAPKITNTMPSDYGRQTSFETQEEYVNRHLKYGYVKIGSAKLKDQDYDKNKKTFTMNITPKSNEQREVCYQLQQEYANHIIIDRKRAKQLYESKQSRNVNIYQKYKAKRKNSLWSLFGFGNKTPSLEAEWFVILNDNIYPVKSNFQELAKRCDKLKKEQAAIEREMQNKPDKMKVQTGKMINFFIFLLLRFIIGSLIVSLVGIVIYFGFASMWLSVESIWEWYKNFFDHHWFWGIVIFFPILWVIIAVVGLIGLIMSHIVAFLDHWLRLL